MQKHKPQSDTEQPHNRIKCRLSKRQIRQAKENAKQRDSARSWSRNFNIDRIETHLKGLKAELAFANYYSLTPDLIFKKGGDDGVDFYVTYKGLKIGVDIKATQYAEDPWLKVRHDNIKETVNAYILAVVDGTQVELVGIAPQNKVTRTTPTTRTGHYKNYILSEEELDPLPPQSEICQATKHTTEKLTVEN